MEVMKTSNKKLKEKMDRICNAMPQFIYIAISLYVLPIPQAVTHSLVLLKMGKIISRNMLS